MSSNAIYTQVNEHYSRLAREISSNEAEHHQKVALSFGYLADELLAVPEGANLGVSCGNPLALASLKEGETVVDLGSGAGFDVFLAARKVGATGLAIGVDMSKDMLARANANAAKSHITNVKFVESPITDIDLESSSADCVISNCVINLVPKEDKHLVFEEVFRILRPGGRVAVSDILAKKVMPDDLLTDMSLYVGCIAGASLVEEYETYLKNAGFQDILILDKKNDLNIYKDGPVMENEGVKKEIENTSKPSCCGASTSEPEKVSSCCVPKISATQSAGLVADTDFNEWVGSFGIYAVKGNASSS